MIVYLDTSALIKLFVDEPQTGIVADTLDKAQSVFTHLITYAEARAALARALRMKRVTPEGLESRKTALEHHWSDLEVIMPDIPLVKRAGDMAEIYALRGYDSIHLAAAELLTKQTSMRLTFACFDNNLNTAADILGMTTLAQS